MSDILLGKSEFSPRGRYFKGILSQKSPKYFVLIGHFANLDYFAKAKPYLKGSKVKAYKLCCVILRKQFLSLLMTHTRKIRHLAKI